MPETIPNLWPEDLNVDVQTPHAILQVQANLLGKVTRGILQGSVETESTKDEVQHRLVVVAPAYNGYRHTLLVAIHHPDLPYPTEIRAESLQSFAGEFPTAESDTAMVILVARALGSSETRAIILSLIAMSNEAQPAGADAPRSNPESADAARQHTSHSDD
jgi:hypothetical protein